MLNRNSERIPRRLRRGSRANIEISLNVLTVEDSLQRAAGFFNSTSALRSAPGGSQSSFLKRRVEFTKKLSLDFNCLRFEFMGLFRNQSPKQPTRGACGRFADG
jgi:hypothetical protein